MSDSRITISSSEFEYANLFELFESNDLRSGDTILLHRDSIIEEPVVITKNCTLDLNRCTLTISTSAGLLVKGGANVVIVNGFIETSFDNDTYDAILVQGSKTTLVLEGNLSIDTLGTAVHARRRGNIVVNGATIRSTGQSPTIRVDDSDSSLTVNLSILDSYESNALTLRNGGSAIVHSGDIFTESGKPAIVVNGQESKFTMNSGTIVCSCDEIVDLQDGASSVICSEVVISGQQLFDDAYLQLESNDILGLDNIVDSEEIADVSVEETSVEENIESTFVETEIQEISESAETSEIIEENRESSIDSEISENLDTISNLSVNVTQKINIYKSPSRKHLIASWKGALTILSRGYTNASKEEFVLVKFKVPGSGKSATGYVFAEDIF